MILSQLAAIALFASGTPTLRLSGTIQTKYDDVWSVAVSGDGRRVLASTLTGLCVYDLASKKELYWSEKWTDPCALAANAGIVVAFGESELGVLDFPQLKPRKTIPLNAMGMEKSLPTAVAATQDGSGACVADDEGRVAWIDLKTYKVTQLHRSKAMAWGVAISPDGRTVAAPSSSMNDFNVVVLKVGSGEIAAQLGGFGEAVGALAFASDGNSLIAGSDDGLLRQFNVKDWKEVSRARHQGIAFCAVALPGSNRILVASAAESSETSRISLLALPDFKTLAFADVKGEIWWLAASSDAKTVAACGDSSAIQIFSLVD